MNKTTIFRHFSIICAYFYTTRVITFDVLEALYDVTYCVTYLRRMTSGEYASLQQNEKINVNICLLHTGIHLQSLAYVDYKVGIHLNTGVN